MTGYKDVQNLVMEFLNDPATGSFEETALKVFRFQFHSNPGYQAYCKALSRDPETVSSWHEIPAVPCDAFKHSLPPFCGDEASAVHTFLTSGTTNEVRGRHLFRELDTYRAAIVAGWRQAGLPDSLPLASFIQKPTQRPESSLSHMIGVLAEANKSHCSWLITKKGSLDLATLQQESEPLLLLGTAVDFFMLTAGFFRNQKVAENSWIFITGGFKNLHTSTTPEDLYQRLAENLGIADHHIINEYGMTELSSQAYAIGRGSTHKCPPWMRARVIDPETGSEQAVGVPGYLELYDLANLGSAVAVRTQDIATAVSHSEFLLQGRDPSALPRGCSRASTLSPAIRP